MEMNEVGELEEVKVFFGDVGSDGNPLPVTKFNYCLVCGDISVMYVEGNIIKREADEFWDGQSFQDLFDNFSEQLGVKKSLSKGKCEWNFDIEPLPLCVDCERLFHLLGQACRHAKMVKKRIKTAMSNAEEKYVREDIYSKQDDRFFEFRKHALGDEFKGHMVISSKSVINQRVPNNSDKVKGGGIVCNEPVTSTSASTSCFKAETATSPLSREQASTSPLNSATAAKAAPRTLNQSASCKTKDKANPPKETYAKVNEENNATTFTSLRRSLRVRNKEVKYREDSPPPDEDDFCTEVITKKSDSDSEKRKNESAKFTDWFPKSGQKRMVRGENRNRMPRQNLLSSPIKFGVITEWNSSFKKRGRKIGSKNEQFTSRRYTSRNLKSEADVSFHQNGSDDNEKYLMAAALIDQLSGNYYYREIQFVWIEEAQSYQCSSCSTFIRSETVYGLKGKFYKHYLVAHSDRFQCRLCPALNRFQNDLELHKHFRVYHPNFLHFEPQLDWRPRARRVSAPSTANIFKELGLENFKPAQCAICLKPMNSANKKEVEEHKLSHMNAEEKATFFKISESVKRFKKRRKIGNPLTTSSVQIPVAGSTSTGNIETSKTNECVHEKLQNPVKTVVSDKGTQASKEVIKEKIPLNNPLDNELGQARKVHNCLDFECTATFLSDSELQYHYRKTHGIIGRMEPMKEDGMGSADMDVEMDAESSPQVIQMAVSHSNQVVPINEISFKEEVVPRDMDLSLLPIQNLDDHDVGGFDYSQLIK